MSGRYTKVVAGYEDVFLTGQPRTSYFLSRYNKKLPSYEIYTIETNIIDKVDYGILLRTVIPDKGDIIKSIMIKVIVPTDYITMYASYALIEYCDLIIGGQLIDRLTGEYMSLILDKKCSLTQQNSILNFGTTASNKSLSTDAGLTQLFFEIPFYFFNKMHLGIPICALYKHKIEFHVKIKEWTLLKETRYFSDPNNFVGMYEDNQRDNVIPLKNFSTLVEYIKLPDEVRDKIKNSTMTYTITQTQLQHELIPKYAETFDTSLKFINPVHNLLFYYKTRNCMDRKLFYGGNGSRLDDLRWWGLSEVPPSTYINKIKELVYKYGNILFKTLPGLEVPPNTFGLQLGYPLYLLNFEFSSLHHMIDLELKLNGETIIDRDNSGHFLMMNQVHKLMNKGLVNTPMIYSGLGVRSDYAPCCYLHTFTENFNDENPGGQINFSRIRDKDIHINLVPSLYDRSLHIYAQSNNILKVKDGMAGLMFTSPIEYQAFEYLPKSWFYNVIYFDNPTKNPNTPGWNINEPDTVFYGLEKQLNTPYLYKRDYTYLYFYNGTTYQLYKLNNETFKYLDAPDIIVDNDKKPPISSGAIPGSRIDHVQIDGNGYITYYADDVNPPSYLRTGKYYDLNYDGFYPTIFTTEGQIISTTYHTAYSIGYSRGYIDGLNNVSYINPIPIDTAYNTGYYYGYSRGYYAGANAG